MIENWQIPLLMTFLAGLATILGGFITFTNVQLIMKINKNNIKEFAEKVSFFFAN